MAETTDAIPSLQPTRPSILRSRSTSDVSTASTSSEFKSSSITFAPLPEIATRKRKNTRPLGLASRAEMLRKSRQRFNEQMYHDHDGPPPEEEEDVPLPDLGKIVKDLWRTVSRQGKDKAARTTPLPVHINPKEGLVSSFEKPCRIDEECGDGEGGVWMEEVTWTSPDTSSSSPSPPLLPHPTSGESKVDARTTAHSRSFLDQYDGNGLKTHTYQRKPEDARGHSPE